ncbi:hypothetical protein Dsin_013129 [Dipteronia sinensis]|uniref:Uncharacterized protein n=1 Tax=Dipteronia sinensis TaxID=43782 RepID=A0AAE0E8U1_9ROSI|nr:hypothetical protein Dsin_013129 [Dipteronia sinensis]
MSAVTCNRPTLHILYRPPPLPPISPFFSRQIHFPCSQPPHLRSTLSTGLKSHNRRFMHIFGGVKAHISAWEEEPYEILSSGKKSYLDEQDVVTFLNPPKELIPFDPASYNPAAYLWKKIEDMPEERRHRLLHLLKPRLISRAWEIAGTRYDDPKLSKKSASNLLSIEDDQILLEFYNCRTSGGPWPIAWFNFFKKAIFRSNNGNTYGRFFGGSVLSQFPNSFSPLYFEVRQLREVMPTEQPCDFAYDFGDGLLDLHQYPQGFPTPVKHPYPFDDQVVIYIRHIGPGVLVGQAWQEGKELQQVPRKFCGEILMVKDHSVSRDID